MDLLRDSKVIGTHNVKPGIRLVQSRKHPGPGQPAEDVDTQVIQEDALTIDVEDVGTYTLMWTPTDLVEADGYLDSDDLLGEQNSAALALTAGFLFTEGIIQGLEDIHTMASCNQTPGVVRVQLKAPEDVVTDDATFS